MSGLFLEDLVIGRHAERRNLVTAAEIEAFAKVTGDENPIHLDEAYAAQTRFGGRVAHGMLTAGFISAVLGNDLPGRGAVYLSQTLRFRRPVRIGDEVVSRVEVTEINETRARVSLKTVCMVAGEVVVDGEAVVLAPRRGA
ncbi:MAG: MaoC family dehydratase [Caulobacteraceae bacterium]|nr:MaoC family dehydratase [Caulobacteraceae bacterium]